MPVRPGQHQPSEHLGVVDEVVTVTDAQIAQAALWLFFEAKQVVEPSGAATVAAVMAGAGRIRGSICSRAGSRRSCRAAKRFRTYVHLPDGRFESVPLPRVFEALDGRVLGDNVSVVTLVFLASALVTWVVLERLRIGRYLFAVGDNFEAARLSGVPVRATLLFAYVLSGIFAALAGICQAAQETHGDPETGMGYELDAIAMVVLGGTSLAGGRGGVQLTVIGALTLGYLQKVLSLNAYSTELRLMLTGVILVLAAVFQRRFARLDLRPPAIRLRPVACNAVHR